MELGEVIAERQLEIAESTQSVMVRIGRPMPDPRPGGDWCCPYQIEGVGSGEVRAAFGVDSVQAFGLCLRKVGAELEQHRRTEGVRLTWLGQEDLGFPGG